MAVNKQAWLPIIREQFQRNNDFLMHGVNLDAWVENNTLHAAQAGAEPTVVINPSSFPLTPAQRTDTDIPMVLETYSSNPTYILNTDEVETNYDKKASVVRGHTRAINRAVGDKGIHSIAPTGNTTLTPILNTTGSVVAATGARKMTEDDGYLLAEKMDSADIQREGRVLVLPPVMFWEIYKADPKLRGQLERIPLGQNEFTFMYFFAGFEVIMRSQTLYYHNANLTKVAYGTSPGADDTLAGVAYVKDYSFGVANGTIEIFSEDNSPIYQGDLLSMYKRALVLPFGQRALGAIVQGK